VQVLHAVSAMQAACIANHSTSIIATRPCKERKDGAPTSVSEKKGRATRPLNDIQVAEPGSSVEFYDYQAPFPSETGISGWPVQAPLGIPGIGEGEGGRSRLNRRLLCLSKLSHE